jgi:hypothetical protein
MNGTARSARPANTIYSLTARVTACEPLRQGTLRRRRRARKFRDASELAASCAPVLRASGKPCSRNMRQGEARSWRTRSTSAHNKSRTGRARHPARPTRIAQRAMSAYRRARWPASRDKMLLTRSVILHRLILPLDSGPLWSLLSGVTAPGSAAVQPCKVVRRAYQQRPCQTAAPRSDSRHPASSRAPA